MARPTRPTPAAQAASTASISIKLMKRNPKMSYEDACRVWRFVENVAASPMACWYQIAGVHGGGSPIMETIALNIETDYENYQPCYTKGSCKG